MGCIFFCFTTRPILIMCVLTSTSTLSFSLTLGMRRLARHQRPCKHFNEQSLIFPFPIFWLPLSRSTGEGNQAVGPRSKVDSVHSGTVCHCATGPNTKWRRRPESAGHPPHGPGPGPTRAVRLAPAFTSSGPGWAAGWAARHGDVAVGPVPSDSPVYARY